MKQKIVHTYQLRYEEYLSFSLKISAPGEPVEREQIIFEGAIRQPFQHNGTYSTTNERIIKALEAHDDFGGRFFKLAQDEDTPQADALDGESSDERFADYTYAPEDITNFTTAKAYLLKENPGLEPEAIKSKVLLLAFAREHKIYFPAWAEVQ